MSSLKFATRCLISDAASRTISYPFGTLKVEENDSSEETLGETLANAIIAKVGDAQSLNSERRIKEEQCEKKKQNEINRQDQLQIQHVWNEETKSKLQMKQVENERLRKIASLEKQATELRNAPNSYQKFQKQQPSMIGFLASIAFSTLRTKSGL